MAAARQQQRLSSVGAAAMAAAASDGWAEETARARRQTLDDELDAMLNPNTIQLMPTGGHLMIFRASLTQLFSITDPEVRRKLLVDALSGVWARVEAFQQKVDSQLTTGQKADVEARRRTMLITPQRFAILKGTLYLCGDPDRLLAYFLAVMSLDMVIFQYYCHSAPAPLPVTQHVVTGQVIKQYGPAWLMWQCTIAELVRAVHQAITRSIINHNFVTHTPRTTS